MANSNENPNNLFREKSIERISSPEDLNDYVKVANPGVWMILAAIIIFLAGFCIWAFNDALETTIPAVVITSDGHTDCFVSETYINKISEGMSVKCNDKEYTIKAISKESLDADDILSDYAKHIAEFKDGEWMHAIALSEVTEDGVYAAKIVTESIQPIKFVFS